LTESASAIAKNKNMYYIISNVISEKVAELETTDDKEGNGQSVSGPIESGVPQPTEMKQPKSRYLAKSLMPFGPTGKLYIKCEQGRTGHKTIEISMTIVVRMNLGNFCGNI
jgi:hypothetical protein